MTGDFSSSAGTKLGNWYSFDRILDGDRYDVQIVP